MINDKEKSCMVCYWTGTRQCNWCNGFSEFDAYCNECDLEMAEFELEGKLYCPACMLKELGIEKRKVISYDYYDKNGEYLGVEDEYTDGEIIVSINNKVKCLGEDD